MDNVRTSKKLMKRFVKDYNLPINVFTDEMFKYYSELYDFFPKEKWENLCKTIEEKYDGNVELWLDYCAKVRDAAIYGVMETEEYKKFNNCQLADLLTDIGQQVPRIGEHSVYNEENQGLHFISIDMKKANFQALKYVGVIKDETYADFIKRFGGDDYIIDSKYLRQVIFGKMNASRTIQVEKYIMCRVYVLVNEYLTNLGYKFYSLNSDELVYRREELGDSNTTEQDMDVLVQTVKDNLGIDVRAECYILGKLDIKNANGNNVDAYVKWDVHKNEETLKKASTTFYPQIYKIWKGYPVDKKDLVFFFEDQLATFNEPLVYEYNC